ncbi:MAG: hypothetical protein ABIK62_04460 [candidate division WOR-3 bacterium]
MTRLAVLASVALVLSLPVQAETGISGMVFNLETQQPIPGATVCC